jgi:alkylated DNA nucleotide flippase Atl1
MSKPKSWLEKLREPQKSVKKMTGKGMMYISTPNEIESIIKKTPKGKLTTTKSIAEKLTSKYKVDFTCPLTTGIFTSIVANATEEALSQGEKKVAPYWRVIKSGGYLYDKYLGKILPQKKHLKTEGYSFEKTSDKKPLKVKNFEKHLI